MFSSITMASSTTKPTAIVSAINDKLSQRIAERPPSSAHAPSSASGTVTVGMMVAQKAAQEDEDHHHHQEDGEASG